MLTEFSARDVGLKVLSHLEHRRPDIVGDAERVRAEVEQALVPVRKAYRECELPGGYLAALEDEVRSTVPTRWLAIASDFTEREKRQFGVWRGGDPLARASYLLVGLVVGGLIVAAPFIPIWEKWFPFLVALSSFFLPDAQVWWQKRRYAQALGEIALELGRVQGQLDAHFADELLLDACVGEGGARSADEKAGAVAAKVPIKEGP